MSIDSLQATENASAAHAVAPRISKDFIEGQIEHIVYFTGDAAIAGGLTARMGEFGFPQMKPCPDQWQDDYSHHTYCLITTKAGFSVTGHSAPADPNNFNDALGRQLAYENAFRQLWPLFAFTALEMVATGVTYGEFGQNL